MTSMSKATKESVQLENASPVYVEANAPIDDEEEVEEAQKINSPPYIFIDTESMQVDSTHIIVDDK